MDQTTQQNAALVEEMAAAAGSLSSQANELVQAVAVFKIAGRRSDSGQRADVESTGNRKQIPGRPRTLAIRQ
jgi:methyl-accepting chemotaxis protein